MTPTIYVNCNEVLEPIGQSQLLAHLRGLLLPVDPDLPSRSRLAAEDVFSLRYCTACYAQLYRDITVGERICVA